MRIYVLADEIQWKYLQSLTNEVNWIRVSTFDELITAENASAVFNLMQEAANENYTSIKIPVFINCVSETLTGCKHADHVVRVNGWPGFLNRKKWEVAGKLSNEHVMILQSIHQTYQLLPDEPGMVSPRILSMIINEAYFAKEQGVSTSAEIDEAMKLGTNYPKGPFEWSKEIGLKKIYHLLKTLAINDSRYQPSTLLEKEAQS